MKSSSITFRSLLKNSDITLGIGVIALVLLLITPLTPFVLDLFLVVSIAISLGILLLSLYTKRPLDFSIFPSLLLLVTLFRLALNVASTRLILSDGHTGTGAAGQLIKSFGDFVVRGNYVVGLIVFIILVIINFIVITKGSGRVSEVAARFTLDALPGKQMAIDADLNAGIINEKEAQKRRKTVEAEADFYGAMDGASKFVRGDAIAGILVTLVNIVGGLIIGVAQQGLDVATAAANYTLLSVGDGLVSQVPALIVSTAAGLVVTRASSGDSIEDQVGRQLFFNERIFYILSGAMASMGLILYEALFPFLVLAVLSGGLGWVIKNSKEARTRQEVDAQANTALSASERGLEPAAKVETLQLEVGYGLISIVEGTSKGDLLERIQSIRKQFAQDMGIVVPPMSIKDNLQLKPGEYVLLLKGSPVARGDLMLDHYLAMDPGGVVDSVEGIPTKEPCFGLDALWIHENNRELAQIAGYTVVDLPSVIATHLTESIKHHGHELLGRQEAQTLIEFVQRTHPKVVEELIPKELSLGVVVKVLQNLLREQVPIRDLVSILETLADASVTSKDIDHLTESARSALGRSITVRLLDENDELPLITFSRAVEEKLIQSVQAGDRGLGSQFLVDPALVRQLVPAATRIVENLTQQGVTPVLLVTPMIRHHVKRLLDRFLPSIVVLSHNEIQPQLRVRSVGSIDPDA